MMHFARHLGRLVKEGLIAFVEDNALTRGAALAFYVVTAIAPVLFIATAIAGQVLGPKAASQALHYQLSQIMNPESANMVQDAIIHVRSAHTSFLGNLLGLLALIITTSGVFTEMEDALNVIWKAPRHESYFYSLLRGRVLSLALVVALGFLFMVSLLFAAGIGVLGSFLNRFTTHGQFVVDVINPFLSFILIALLFALIYKVMPNIRIYWRDVMWGAIGSALFFQLGQVVIAFYTSDLLSADIYGAAGGMIVLMIWGFYSALVFLLGAEFTKVWSHHYGSQKGQP